MSPSKFPNDEEGFHSRNKKWKKSKKEGEIEKNGSLEAESCPICFGPFTDQDIGSPECCDHSFCLLCIKEWSLKAKTCPVDRLPFTLLLVREGIHASVTKVLSVKGGGQLEEVGPSLVCDVCSQTGVPRLLVCAGCGIGMHAHCSRRTPASTTIANRWYCQDCYTLEWERNFEPLVPVESHAYDIYDVLQAETNFVKSLPRPPPLRFSRTALLTSSGSSAGSEIYPVSPLEQSRSPESSPDVLGSILESQNQLLSSHHSVRSSSSYVFRQCPQSPGGSSSGSTSPGGRTPPCTPPHHVAGYTGGSSPSRLGDSPTSSDLSVPFLLDASLSIKESLAIHGKTPPKKPPASLNEDDVDIYSDIESIPDNADFGDVDSSSFPLLSDLNSHSNTADLSNAHGESEHDSSENELVIDEDTPLEQDHLLQDSPETPCAASHQEISFTYLSNPKENNSPSIQIDDDDDAGNSNFGSSNLDPSDSNLCRNGLITNEKSLSSPCSSPHSSCGEDENNLKDATQKEQEAELDLDGSDSKVSSPILCNANDNVIVTKTINNENTIPLLSGASSTVKCGEDKSFLSHDNENARPSSFDEEPNYSKASFLQDGPSIEDQTLNGNKLSCIPGLDSPDHFTQAISSENDFTFVGKQSQLKKEDISNLHSFKQILVQRAVDSGFPSEPASHFETDVDVNKLSMTQAGSISKSPCSLATNESYGQNGESLHIDSDTPIIYSLSHKEDSPIKELPCSQDNSSFALSSLESPPSKCEILKSASPPFQESYLTNLTNNETGTINPVPQSNSFTAGFLPLTEMESITSIVDKLTSQASQVFDDDNSLQKTCNQAEVVETLNKVVLTVTNGFTDSSEISKGGENILTNDLSLSTEVNESLNEADNSNSKIFVSDIRLPETEDISDTEDEPFPLEDPLPEEDEREEGEIVEVEEIKELHPKIKKKVCKKHHRESHDHKNCHSLKALSEKSGDSGELGDQIEFKTKGFEKYTLALADEPNAGWKRLSKSSKERSYRDGKPKDEEIFFKEREIKKKHNKKAVKQESRKKKESCEHKQKKHSKSRKNERKKSPSHSRERSRSKNRQKLNSKYHDRSRSRETRKHSRTRHSSPGRSRSRTRHKVHSSHTEGKLLKRNRARSSSRNGSSGRSQSIYRSNEQSRSRHRSYERSRSRERKYKRSRSRNKSYERSRSPSYERSRSRNHSYPRSRSWNRSSRRSRSRNRDVQRSRSRNQRRRHRSFDRSRSRNRSVEKYRYSSRERSLSRNKSIERRHKGHTKSKYSKDDRSYSRSTSRERSASKHNHERSKPKTHRRSKSKEKIKGKVTKKSLVEQNTKSKSKTEPSQWSKSLPSTIEEIPKQKLFATTKTKKKKVTSADQEEIEEPITKACDGIHHKVNKKKHDKHHALKHNGEKKTKKKKKHVCPHDHAKKKERNISAIDSGLKIELEKHEPCSKSEFYADTLISKLEQQNSKQVNNIDSSHTNAFESKEIYAKGDSIIINLSFNNANRECSKEDVSDLKVTSTNHQDISSPIEGDASLKQDKKSSRENIATSSIEDKEAPSSPCLDDIFWKSAPSPDDSLSKNEEKGDTVKEPAKEDEPPVADSPKVDLSPPSSANITPGECYDPCEPTLSPQIGEHSPEEDEPTTPAHPPPATSLATDAFSLLPNALAYLAQLKPSMLPTPPKGGPPLHAVIPAAAHPPATAAELLHAAFPALRPPEAKRKTSNMASVAPLKRTKFDNEFDKLAQPSEVGLKANNNATANPKSNEKFLQKLNRQERVIEEVKMVLKPFYNKREIDKEDYKQILRKSVPKICHNKSREINPMKIKHLVEGYVKKYKYLRKKLQKQQIEY